METRQQTQLVRPCGAALSSSPLSKPLARDLGLYLGPLTAPPLSSQGRSPSPLRRRRLQSKNVSRSSGDAMAARLSAWRFLHQFPNQIATPKVHFSTLRDPLISSASSWRRKISSCGDRRRLKIRTAWGDFSNGNIDVLVGISLPVHGPVLRGLSSFRASACNATWGRRRQRHWLVLS